MIQYEVLCNIYSCSSRRQIFIVARTTFFLLFLVFDNFPMLPVFHLKNQTIQSMKILVGNSLCYPLVHQSTTSSITSQGAEPYQSSYPC